VVDIIMLGVSGQLHFDLQNIGGSGVVVDVTCAKVGKIGLGW
jgi:hypothetical protein